MEKVKGVVEEALIWAMVGNSRQAKFYKQMSQLEALLAESFATTNLEEGDHRGVEMM